MQKNKDEIIKYINSLENYEGYVQFSDTKIRECDIFKTAQNITLTPTKGFIYEAHFCNGATSVTIRQVNDTWLVSETDISKIDDEDTERFISDIEDFNRKIKMAQVWEEKEDKYCEDMPVKKLQKVVFAGFKGGER